MTRFGLAATGLLWVLLAAACDESSTKRELLSSLGVTVEYPERWATGTAPMPYASCNTCTVIGPVGAEYPYGVQFWEGAHQLGCQLTCYLNIRALPQGPTIAVDANGRVAFQQEFERQRPLGLVNEDGDRTSYREILTVVPLEPIVGLAPEAEVAALFIDAFYRYGDTTGEVQTREALALVLGTIVTPSTSLSESLQQPGSPDNRLHSSRD